MIVRSRVVLLLAVAAHALLTTSACWKGNCLQHNDAGTICYVPHANGATTSQCADQTIASLLYRHINSTAGLSIAYYDELGDFLGPVTWPFPPSLTIPIFLCMSGRRVDWDVTYRTVCRTALSDDDQLDARAHVRECSMDVGQRQVYDGCYNSALPQPTSISSSVLDQPSIAHAFFVLGALVTLGSLAALLFKFYKHAFYAIHLFASFWEYLVGRANDLAAVIRVGDVWRGVSSAIDASLRWLRTLNLKRRQSPTTNDTGSLLVETFELTSSGLSPDRAGGTIRAR